MLASHVIVHFKLRFKHKSESENFPSSLFRVMIRDRFSVTVRVAVTVTVTFTVTVTVTVMVQSDNHPL